MMQAYLNFYRARLEAFRTGELVDVSALAAPVFEQPVALTRGFMSEVKLASWAYSLREEGLVLEVIRTAHTELVRASGAGSSAEPLMVDFGTVRWPTLRVVFCFVQDPGTDTSLPVVTVGFRTEFEDDG